MRNAQEQPDRFIEITSYPYPNDPELAIFRIELEDAGIEYFEKDSQTLSLDPLLSNAIGGVKILVRTENEPEAHEILTEVRQRLGTEPTESGQGRGAVVWLLAAIGVIILVLLREAFLKS